MKLDLPEPFGPIATLIARSGSFSAEAILLNPFTVMQSSSGMRKFRGSVFLLNYSISARIYTQIGLRDPLLAGHAFVNQRFAVGDEGGDLCFDADGDALHFAKFLVEMVGNHLLFF